MARRRGGSAARSPLPGAPPAGRRGPGACDDRPVAPRPPDLPTAGAGPGPALPVPAARDRRGPTAGRKDIGAGARCGDALAGDRAISARARKKHPGPQVRGVSLCPGAGRGSRLVVAGRAADDVPENGSGDRVDGQHVPAVEEHREGGSGVGPPDADVVPPRVQAHADAAGPVDAVGADPPPGRGAGGRGPGQGAVGGVGGGPVQGAVGAELPFPHVCGRTHDAACAYAEAHRAMAGG